MYVYASEFWQAPGLVVSMNLRNPFAISLILSENI